MKKLLLLIQIILVTHCVEAQITTPTMKANFGVDGELRSNYFNNIAQSGNDDWFSYGGAGSGQFVIDTSGAAARMARYAWDMAYRRLPFYKTMRYEPYQLVNNKLLIDAVFIRDYHGDDSTVFASGSNKNGMSPGTWTSPVSQSIPDKNDILDMMVHVRRAGPATSDSLWMFGGLSIENVTGSRYFDFEMYQTDIYYDRASRRFYGYGPDAGHTSWTFDAAGNVVRPGDIIFTTEYGGSTLSALEARIWIDKASMSITPAEFNWTGQFDGASSGSQFGYASITPNTAGAFYIGLSSVNGTWPGPFGIILGDNTMPTTYIARQFMEFSVNLTKLGLDPVTLLGGDACGMPFRRVLVKTRSSSSFTAELKDFVGPFDLFLAPRADAQGDVTMYCGTYGVSNLSVANAVSTSIYTWTTADGHIVGSNSGPSIVADMPGTYVVTQQLQASCSAYATDTLQITYDPNCSLLENNLITLDVKNRNNQAELDWTVLRNEEISYFDVQYSLDGVNFTSAGKLNADENLTASAQYDFMHNLGSIPSETIYYRLQMFSIKGSTRFSKVVKLTLPLDLKATISVTPNPASKMIQVNISSPAKEAAQLMIYDFAGKIVQQIRTDIYKGYNTISIPNADRWPTGLYTVKMIIGGRTLTEKVLIRR